MDGWLALASHLHLPLTECLRETTYRQYLYWQRWLQRQWNEPDRHDHYLMQIAQVVLQAAVKDPSSIKLADQKLAFTFSDPAKKQTTRLDPEAVKAIWMGRVQPRKEADRGRRRS
jgi:hypothetical protein